jgi:putative peptidoglycan lipid II flippase
MRAIFAHGAFDRQAAAQAAIALAAYGVGLPAMVLVRITAASFYARHDTGTPARATVTSIASNIAIKCGLVLGLGWGIGGIALGTAIGAWVNVGMLVWFSKRAGHLTIQPILRRALLPILLAALLAGAGALGGVLLLEHQLLPISFHGMWRDIASLGLATALGVAGYGFAVLVFRRRLPLGR